jgi:hypothetical protein
VSRRQAPTAWSLVAVPPAAALHLSLLPRVVDQLQADAVAVLAATYVPGGARLVDHLYQGDRRARRSRWGDSSFLEVHEWDGPTVVLLVDAPARPGAALTAGPVPVHVPAAPEPLADLLFGCGCHGLPRRLAGPDRSSDLLGLAHSFRASIDAPATAAGAEVRDRFLQRCTLHADLLTLGPPAHCQRGAWRAGLLRWVAAAVGDTVAAPTLASWQLVQQDVLLAADDVELQVLRAWLAGDDGGGPAPALAREAGG